MFINDSTDDNWSIIESPFFNSQTLGATFMWDSVDSGDGFAWTDFTIGDTVSYTFTELDADSSMNWHFSLQVGKMTVGESSLLMHSKPTETNVFTAWSFLHPLQRSFSLRLLLDTAVDASYTAPLEYPYVY